MTVRWPWIAVVLAVGLVVVVPTEAAGGWYLMIPPLAPFAGTPGYSASDEGYYVNDTAPLNIWEHRGSFDSVRECEHESWDAREEGFKSTQEASAFYQQSPTDLNLTIWNTASARWSQSTNARCIASDDPRLK